MCFESKVWNRSLYGTRIFIHKEYRAEQIDIMSCGVVLITLLAGELPWDVANNDCNAFKQWKESNVTFFPWNKIDNLVLCMHLLFNFFFFLNYIIIYVNIRIESIFKFMINLLSKALVRKILSPNVSKRYTLSQIQSHQWFKKKFTNSENRSNISPQIKAKKQCLMGAEAIGRLASLANIPMTTTFTESSVKTLCFSQPAEIENMFLSTQLLSTPHSTPNGNIYHRLVKRMTRFFTYTDSNSNTLEKMINLFEKLNYNYKTYS